MTLVFKSLNIYLLRQTVYLGFKIVIILKKNNNTFS